ncbi:MAG: glutamine-hydrolyzing carbamoyl-phosphate synthase small subunit [Chthonomonadales bacterium]
MRAQLVLEDGTVYQGKALGSTERTYGEVVFNTGMTGYQEILTDPSYAGQIVCLTYPLIGNYGINTDDVESRQIQVQGFVVHEAAAAPSNWRNAGTIDDYLREKGISAISGVDTRAVTRKLRSHGVMMGAITTDESPAEVVERIKNSPSYSGLDFARKVTIDKPTEWLAEGEQKYRVALLDCGVKYNILRSLAKQGCTTTVFPCTTSAAEILDTNPDGIMLSPGPGDPATLGYAVQTVKELVGKKPILGVCLGNQLLGAAFGASTYKLKFGHRGSNHPVLDKATDKVHITSQNHGYAVNGDELTGGMEVGFVNLNDGTVEGLRHRELPIISIQYHPEASPGPTDSAYFFSQFAQMIDGS